MKARNERRAKQVARQACTLGPKNPDVHFTFGMITARLGEVGDADTALQKAASLGKPSHLCAAQHVRARIESLSKLEARKRPKEVFDEAFKYLQTAKKAPTSGKKEMRHHQECDRLERRLEGLM